MPRRILLHSIIWKNMECEENAGLSNKKALTIMYRLGSFQGGALWLGGGVLKVLKIIKRN